MKINFKLTLGTPTRAWSPAVSLAAGLLAALAHPPFGFLPGLLAYGMMMRLGDDAATLRSAFWRGWLCGLSYFVVGFWWVAEAFYVDAATFGWMAPFAVALLAGGLALFWGAAFALYRLIRPTGAMRVLVFAGALTALEWTRGHILTGLPWNLPGTSWAAGGAMSQTAALVGVYGLTWLTLAIAAAPALIFDRPRARGAGIAIGLAAAVFASLFGYGALRLAAPSFTPPGQDELTIRIVQPNIPQAAKYDTAAYDNIVNRYLALTASPPAPGRPRPDLIVWPEGALPRSLDHYLARDDSTRLAISQALLPGQRLIVGGYRSDEAGRVFNSMAVVLRTENEMEIIGVYDKYRLVPFGEFTPPVLEKLGFGHLVPLEGFTPGPRPQPLNIGPALIQPLICYEALFPGLAHYGQALAGKRADMIVTISNDAWFGATSGPRQHLNQARYRSIEDGLPQARTTPTGISAMIDAHGRIAPGQLLDLGAAGILDVSAPLTSRQAMSGSGQLRAPTPYGRTGDLGMMVLLAVSCLVVVMQRAKTTKKGVTAAKIEIN